MNLARLEAQLKIDEGVRLIVYKDSLGLLTVGVGHLVRPDDHLVFGQTISQRECDAFFKRDLGGALADCAMLFPAWGTLSDVAQEVLANMMFNLGKARLGKFVRLRKAIAIHDYALAAQSMEESHWATQVGNRAKRLVSRMKAETALIQEEEVVG